MDADLGHEEVDYRHEVADVAAMWYGIGYWCNGNGGAYIGYCYNGRRMGGHSRATQVAGGSAFSIGLIMLAEAR